MFEIDYRRPCPIDQSVLPEGIHTQGGDNVLLVGRGGAAALTALFVLMTIFVVAAPQTEARLENHSPGFVPPNVDQREAVIGSLDTDESTIISAIVGRVSA